MDKRMFETVGLIGKPGDERVRDTLAALIGQICGGARRVLLDESSAADAPGDSVTVQLSPYDLSRGRIVYRER